MAMNESSDDLTWIKAARAAAWEHSGSTAWRLEMPLETILVSVALIVVFGGYAAVLGWAAWYTRGA